MLDDAEYRDILRQKQKVSGSVMIPLICKSLKGLMEKLGDGTMVPGRVKATSLDCRNTAYSKIGD